MCQSKKTRRSGFLLFWVTRYNYLGDHAARAKISSLDAFAFKGFASTAESPQPYGFCFPELSTLLLVALSKPWQAHQKHIVKSLAKTSKRQGDRSFEYTPQYACGGPGGSRTRVQNTFLFASFLTVSTAIKYLSPGLPSDPVLYFLHSPR